MGGTHVVRLMGHSFAGRPSSDLSAHHCQQQHLDDREFLDLEALTSGKRRVTSDKSRSQESEAKKGCASHRGHYWLAWPGTGPAMKSWRWLKQPRTRQTTRGKEVSGASPAEFPCTRQLPSLLPPPSPLEPPRPPTIPKANRGRLRFPASPAGAWPKASRIWGRLRS